MNKEQIIIDGVDVKNCKGIDLGLFPLAKCKFLKFKTSDGGIAGIWCSDHTNCYYKQLARKTQECESLKEEIEILKDNFDTATRDCNELIEELRQECEELKKQLMQKSEVDMFFNTPIEGWSSNLCGICKFKNCLAEIKEIAEPFCNACQEFEPEKKGSNCMYCNYGIILRKISEVEK